MAHTRPVVRAGSNYDSSSSTAEDVRILPELAITKTDNQTTATPGQPIRYEIVVTNTGGGVTNAPIVDAIPSDILMPTWTCTAAPNSSCAVVGPISGDINTTVSLAPMGIVTFTVNGTISPAAIGTLINTATITAPTGFTETITSNNIATDITALAPSADLAVQKVKSVASPVVNTQFVYVVQAVNNGPSVARNAVVTDVLPAGVSYTSHSTTRGTWDQAGTGRWMIGDMAVGEIQTLLMTVTRISTASSITNVAEGYSDTFDPNLVNNRSQVAIDQQVADLSLVKTVNQASVVIGTPVTFTIVLSNAGPATATGLRVFELLPSGLSYGSHLASQGVYTSSTGAWDVGTVNANAAATLQIVAHTSVLGTYTNTTQVSSSDQFDPDSVPGNNNPNEDDQSSVSVRVMETPKIGLAKTASASTHIGNGVYDVQYTFTVGNYGDVPLTNVQVAEDLRPVYPAPTAFVVVAGPTATGSLIAASNFDGQTNLNLLASGSTLGLSERQTIRFTVRVMPKNTDTFTNTALASGTGPGGTLVTDISTDGVFPGGPGDDGDPNTANTPTPVTLPVSNLRVDKTASDSATLPNSTITYTLVVTNDGPSAAQNVVLTDALPSGVMFVSAQPAQTSGPNPLVWNIGTVNAGHSIQRTVVVRVNADAINSVLNSAGATTTTPETNTSDNFDTTLTGIGQMGLSISKQANPTTGSPVAVNQIVTYTLTAVNTGTIKLDNVVIADTIPAGTEYVNGSAQPATPTPNPPRWVIPSLGPGQSVSASFAVRVLQNDSSHSITNTAFVSNLLTGLLTSNTVVNIFTPTLVSLVSFNALPVEFTNSVKISWRTSMERNTWGFYVLRSETDKRADAVRVSDDLIVGRGQSGAAYEIVDAAAARTAHYFLQEIEVTGAVNWYGPIAVGQTTSALISAEIPAALQPIYAALPGGVVLPAQPPASQIALVAARVAIVNETAVIGAVPAVVQPVSVDGAAAANTENEPHHVESANDAAQPAVVAGESQAVSVVSQASVASDAMQRQADSVAGSVESVTVARGSQQTAAMPKIADAPRMRVDTPASPAIVWPFIVLALFAMSGVIIWRRHKLRVGEKGRAPLQRHALYPRECSHLPGDVTRSNDRFTNQNRIRAHGSDASHMVGCEDATFGNK